ncbi:MAG TPA: M20/M25/M40 family metallo-hydrolase [Candidatus Deferrimicrobiaceae bacterium]|jgi:Zn-dependent M28 family amino/carboxypeptidase|nr:M20/M25/M40 family metallo-hydrolase [Candidatus Deferrimicrobiaceae bacterium]
MTMALRCFTACQIALLLLSVFVTAQTPAPTPQSGLSRMAIPQASASEQQNFPPLLLQQLSAIKAAALNDDYAYRQLAHLTENIGARPTGSPQALAAAEYVAAELRQLGLDVHLQPVVVPHWVRGAETAALVEYPGMVPGTMQKIVLTALGGSSSTPVDGLTADVVTVNSFDELAALSRDKVAGKIVLFNEIFDKEKAAAGQAFAAYGEAVRYRAGGPKAAADLGAVAALVRSVGNADYRLPHTGFSFPAGIPAGAVTAEDADLIVHLAAQGKVLMHLTLTPQKLPDETSYNVIADLKGSEHPEQIVVVSGHLDSWDLGTGAIDDGAGVVMAMETAEILQRLHLRPARTLRVIAWMDEETGGSGSKAYTAEYSADFPHYIAAIESDSGAAHPMGFEIKALTAAIEALRPVQSVLLSIGATVLQPASYAPEADIEGMSSAGVPAIGLIQDGRTYFNYHHTAADTLDKVVPSELRENAAAMAVMAYALAGMTNPLPR